MTLYRPLCCMYAFQGDRGLVDDALEAGPSLGWVLELVRAVEVTHTQGG
jgi:hypothetical protein